MTNENTPDFEEISVPDSLSGYEEFDTYAAQSSVQGGRTHYTIVVPVQRVTSFLPIPDPAKPFEDNRQVRVKHAEKFGDYVRTRPDWHSGPLTVRTLTGVVHFNQFKGFPPGPVLFGTLQVPRGRSTEFRIIDGQHRVLGIETLRRKIADEKFEKSNRLELARSSGQRDQIHSLEAQLDEVKRVEKRLREESITVDLVIENDTRKARQVFVDVADNALGIPRPVRARFDMEKVVNRAMGELLSDPPQLLQGKVDDQKDRISGSNPNFIGAGTLADVVRILKVGVNGRISRVQEDELQAADLARDCREFFNLLSDTFEILGQLKNDEVDSQQLRESSLLGSTTMLRILAGVYHQVRSEKGIAAAANLLRKIAPHTHGPIQSSTPSGLLWINCGSQETFVEGAMAPGARAQQVREAVEVISSWASKPPYELTS